MLVTVLGIVIVSSAVQPSKALSFMVVNPSFRVIFFNFSQFSKASIPILVIEDEIVMLSKRAQLENKLSLISFIEDGNSIVVNASQPEKALFFYTCYRGWKDNASDLRAITKSPVFNACNRIWDYNTYKFLCIIFKGIFSDRGIYFIPPR